MFIMHVQDLNTRFEYMLSIVVLDYHVMAFIYLYGGAPLCWHGLKVMPAWIIIAQ